jgi:acetylornithine deacetylase/succinyl-diaminopimelate desuccinylase-like protein
VRGEERNPSLQKIAENVSVERMEDTISEMVAFGTRYPHAKQLEVAEFLLRKMREYIGTADFHEYEYWGVAWRNVVGTIPGTKNPEEIYIVCAHLDSKSDKRLVYAPGADDNASGCAAVLELAALLADHSFEKSIRFIIFSREETGQNGSKAYLKSLDKEKEKIRGAINLDMIAFGPQDEDIDLVTRPKHAWLVEKISVLAHLYNFPTRKVVHKDCF